jgi:hypothetical protein
MNRQTQLELWGSKPHTIEPFGWLGCIQDFLTEPEANWLQRLNCNYQRLYHQQATNTQQGAWLDCYRVLRSHLPDLVQQCPDSAHWTFIFEYELPREGGRRPDLVILARNHIVVVEFKQKVTPSASDLDQTAAYARDLADYHRESHAYPVSAVLVPTRRQIKGDRWITSIRQRNVPDPLRLRLNSYRVLLTRGRDGFIIFVPPEPKMETTAQALQASGLSCLN